MSDFLFHKVSEKEKQEIKEQAKSIMDDFSRKLSKIDRKMEEPLIERAEGEREESAHFACTPKHFPKKMFTKGKEGDGRGCDEEFRKIMFENAPEKNNDFIIAEKKKW